MHRLKSSLGSLSTAWAFVLKRVLKLSSHSCDPTPTPGAACQCALHMRIGTAYAAAVTVLEFLTKEVVLL
jgi:hypothetical protein